MSLQKNQTTIKVDVDTLNALKSAKPKGTSHSSFILQLLNENKNLKEGFRTLEKELAESRNLFAKLALKGEANE